MSPFSVNPGSVSGPSLVSGPVYTVDGAASVTIRGAGSAPIVPTGSSGLQAHPTLQGSPPIPQLSSGGTGARANPITTVTQGGTGPTLGGGRTLPPLPSGIQPSVTDLGTRTGSGTSSPNSSGLANAAPLAGAGTAGGGGLGLSTSVGAAGAGTIAGVVVGGLAIGLGLGEGIRRAGLAAEEAGIIPDTPFFEPYPPGWWDRQPNESPAPVPVTTFEPPPFTGGQSPGITYAVTTYRAFDDPTSPGGRFHRTATRNYTGPIGLLAELTSTGGAMVWSVTHGTSGKTLLQQVGLHLNPVAYIVGIIRLDGQPDTGGDPAPTPISTPGSAPGSIPAHVPSGSPLPGLGLPLPGPSSAPGSGLLPPPLPGLVPSLNTPPGISPPPSGSLSFPPSPGLQGSATGSSAGSRAGPPDGPRRIVGSGNQPGLSSSSNPSPPPPQREQTPSQPDPCRSGCGSGLLDAVSSIADLISSIINALSGGNNDDPDCDVCALLEQAIALLEPEGNNTLKLLPCGFDPQPAPEEGDPVPEDPEGTKNLPWTGTGIEALLQAAEVTQQGIAEIWEKVKCEQPVPDGPIVIYPNDVYSEFTLESRLLLEFTTVENFPKRAETSSKWSLEIPNPRPDLSWCSDFEEFSFDKGNWYGRCIWSDSGIRSGSYCRDEAEALRVCGLIQGLTTLEPKRVRITSSGKTGMNTSSVRVYRAVLSTFDNGELVACVKFTPVGC